jgi:hypothetical protein
MEGRRPPPEKIEQRRMQSAIDRSLHSANRADNKAHAHNVWVEGKFFRWGMAQTGNIFTHKGVRR